MIPDLIPDQIQFAENPEPRCPCVLLVDVSGSMSGDKMEQLNNGIAAFARELKTDLLASLRTEVAIITFASTVETAQDFVTADRFEPPRLDVQHSAATTEDICFDEPLVLGLGEGMGGTSSRPPDYTSEDGLHCYKAGLMFSGTLMSRSIDIALDEIEKRKQSYRDNGIDYFRPWLFLITDGEPTESRKDVVTASQRLKDADSQKRVAAFSVGVEGANMDMLALISPRRPLMLKGLEFSSMFIWLSHSMSRVSRSRTDDEITLDVDGLRDWAET